MRINQSELNILGLNTLRVSGRKSRYQPDKSYTPTVEVRVALARSLRLDLDLDS